VRSILPRIGLKRTPPMVVSLVATLGVLPWRLDAEIFIFIFYNLLFSIGPREKKVRKFF